MSNTSLDVARKAKNDEFYTQYDDIQKEINAYLEYDPNVFRGKTILLPCDDPEWSNFTKFFAQNFEALGLKKIISTSYAIEAKNRLRPQEYQLPHQVSLFDYGSPLYDEEQDIKYGKIYTLSRDKNNSGRIDIDDLEWQYLEGDGDFRSEEVRKLRDESDIIVTNPPFSLFREFMAWIMQSDKKFLVIANQNAITYKEIFPLLKNNMIWLGCHSGGQAFVVPDSFEKNNTYFENGKKFAKFGNICWFTNLDHGRRHQPMRLMTTADNLKYSKHKEIRECGYLTYENYDAIEISYIDSIPSDYWGNMGVPISFLDKYCPEQFEIIGASESEGKGFSNGLWNAESRVSQPVVGGIKKYKRIFIKLRR